METNALLVSNAAMQLHMNHVNLIGRVSSKPRIVELPNGKRIANFTIATSQRYLNKDGILKNQTEYHRISASGKWVNVVEEYSSVGFNVAIEGKMVSRYYCKGNGQRNMFSEIEVNDLIIL